MPLKKFWKTVSGVIDEEGNLLLPKDAFPITQKLSPLEWLITVWLRSKNQSKQPMPDCWSKKRGYKKAIERLKKENLIK